MSKDDMSYSEFLKEIDDYIDEMNEQEADPFGESDLSNHSSSSQSFAHSPQASDKTRHLPSKQGIHRKGLKWTLLRLLKGKYSMYAIIGAVVLIVVLAVILIVVSTSGSNESTESQSTTVVETQAPTELTSYQIADVPVLLQSELLAGCELYACTMMMNYLGYDIDVVTFSDEYLITSPISYDESGTRYGPDMHSAFAGTTDTGYGIYAPAMVKSLNKYLDTTSKGQKAYALEDMTIEQMCKEYIVNDIPVAVWATARMDEPYAEKTWVVDYVDENAETKVGDTTFWYEHEHCLLLIGFDEENYYFCDSLEGKVNSYEKAISEQRYEELGKNAVVIK